MLKQRNLLSIFQIKIEYDIKRNTNKPNLNIEIITKIISTTTKGMNHFKKINLI
jgi:hypothetical protein